MCVSRYLEYFGLPLASFTLNSYGLTLLQPRQQWWVPYCPGVSWSLLYLWFHSEAPCWDCLGPHCGNSAAFSGCWMCCEEPRGRMSAQPLEFPQCSDRELSESGTFKERCHIICITPNAKAALLQAQGICTGPKSDAQTTICFELGDRDGRVPVSGLLLSVCAVRGSPPPSQLVVLHMVVYVSYLPGSVSGSLIHCSLYVNKGWPWCLPAFSPSFVLSLPLQFSLTDIQRLILSVIGCPSHGDIFGLK